MITLILVALLFALLIGIFSRSKKRTGYTCPSCVGYVQPSATVCPHCTRPIVRAPAIQSKNGIANYLPLTLAIAAGLIGYAVLITYSHAQQSPQTTFRDSRGSTTGTAQTDSQGTTTCRDSHGPTTGTATTDSQGTTTFRDSRGRTTGTVSGVRR
jgi:hypothetical protein